MNRFRASQLRPYAATCSLSSINPWQLLSPGPSAFIPHSETHLCRFPAQQSLPSPWTMFCSSPPPMLGASTHFSHLIGTRLPPLMAAFPDQDGFISCYFLISMPYPHVHLFIARSGFFNLSYTASSKTCLSTPSEESSLNLN